MEIYENTCAFCHQPCSAFTFSCKHLLCTKCAIRNVFISHIHELGLTETIHLHCTCREGSVDLSLDQLNEILTKTVFNKQEPEKRKDDQEFSQIISDGNIDLNRDGKTPSSSSDVYIEQSTEFPKKCSAHKALDIDLYCVDCQTELCKECIAKGGKHEMHKYKTAQYQAKIFQQKLQNINISCPTYVEFSEKFEKIANRFSESYKSRLTSTMKQLDDLSESIQSLKESFMANMEQINKTGELVLNIIKLLYTYYYTEKSKPTLSVDLSSLKFLNEIKYDFNDLNITLNISLDEEINIIYYLVEGLKAELCPMSVQYDFNHLKTEYRFDPNIEAITGGVSSLIGLTDDRIAVGGLDNKIRIWEEQPEGMYKCTQTLLGHCGIVTSLLLLKNENIASASRDLSIRIWKEEACRNFRYFICVHILLDHTNWVCSLIELSNDELISSSYDKTIKIWKKSDDEEGYVWVQTIDEPPSQCFALAEMNQCQVASGMEDFSIRIYTLDNDKQYTKKDILHGHESCVFALLYIRGGRLVSAAFDNSIKIWSEQSGSYQCTQTLTDHHQSPIRSLLYMNDGRIASGSFDDSIKIWAEVNNSDQFECTQTLNGHTESVIALTQIFDGRIFSGSMDYKILIWFEHTE